MLTGRGTSNWPNNTWRVTEVKSMRFLGVYREQMFSPGRVADDAAIMDTTLAALRTEGHDTDAMRAEALDGRSPDVDCVLTMGQSDRLLGILKDSKRRGVRIVNPVASIRLCHRAPLMRRLARAGLPLPPGKIVPVNGVDGKVELQPSKHYWVKRGDFHKIEPDDVVKVSSRSELEAAFRHFRRRRVAEVVVQEHAEGEVVKFYGVSGCPLVRRGYFAAFREYEDVDAADDLAQLRGVAKRAAAAVGLEVYGGDAIITGTGRVVLIDLNAWPSFSRCRSIAARNIAGYVAGAELSPEKQLTGYL